MSITLFDYQLDAVKRMKTAASCAAESVLERA